MCITHSHSRRKMLYYGQSYDRICFATNFEFSFQFLLTFSHPRAQTRGRPRVPTHSIDTMEGFINQWKINKSYKVVSISQYHQGTGLMLFFQHHPHFSVKKKKILCLGMNGQSKLLSKYFNYLILLLYN